MRIGAAFISDRGSLYLPGCLQSYLDHVELIGGADATLIDDRDHLLGMAGAVRAAWSWALEHDFDFLLHVEEDFRFVTRCPLPEMAAILQRRPDLAQVVLKRQPWSAEETAAGGIVELHPDDYTARSFGPGCEFLEHSRIFSLNPCLIPRSVLDLGWPDDNEAGFTRICVDAGYRFAMFGERGDAPRVEHIGQLRGAGWRL